jgi:hypothetical protein
MEFRTRRGWEHQTTKSERSFTFPRIAPITWPYVRDVAVVQEDYDYGVFLRIPYLNGTIYILNMPENSYDLMRMPSQTLNSIRHAFIKDLGVQLAGSGGVGMYMFGNKQYVLYNMNDYWVAMSLRFEKDIPESGWSELVSSKQIELSKDASLVRFGGPEINNIYLTLDPFEIAIVQAP